MYIFFSFVPFCVRLRSWVDVAPVPWCRHPGRGVYGRAHAEKQRPINWRELLGILRVVQVHGAELAGMTVLIETDSMAAKGAAEKGSSTARSMQELLRRLLEVCDSQSAGQERSETVSCFT